MFSVRIFGLVNEPIGWILGDLQQGHFATLPQEPVQDRFILEQRKRHCRPSFQRSCQNCCRGRKQEIRVKATSCNDALIMLALFPL